MALNNSNWSGNPNFYEHLKLLNYCCCNCQKKIVPVAVIAIEGNKEREVIVWSHVEMTDSHHVEPVYHSWTPYEIEVMGYKMGLSGVYGEDNPFLLGGLLYHGKQEFNEAHTWHGGWSRGEQQAKKGVAPPQQDGLDYLEAQRG